VNPILLNNQVIVYLLSETLLLALLGISFVVTLKILRYWDFGSFDGRQFALERQAYLVTTIIAFVFVLKFLLLPYFVFTIDSLAVLVPGAMCAAGVISANPYGMKLLALKLLIVFGLVLWMALNRRDLEAKDYPLMRMKSALFIGLFLLFLLEYGLDIAYFTHIDVHRPVSCCSALFGQLEGANPLPFGLNIPWLITLFYLVYALVLVTVAANQHAAALGAYALFVVIAYYAVVYFFGTYIYELPTHKCPFCMFQKSYYYVGYAVWGSLFAGVFTGMTCELLALGTKLTGSPAMQPAENCSALPRKLLGFFVLLCTAYVAIYYFRTGVLL
jgi:hypothetical protein